MLPYKFLGEAMMIRQGMRPNNVGPSPVPLYGLRRRLADPPTAHEKRNASPSGAYSSKAVCIRRHVDAGASRPQSDTGDLPPLTTHMVREIIIALCQHRRETTSSGCATVPFTIVQLRGYCS